MANTFTPFDDGSKYINIKNSRTNHKSENIQNLYDKIDNVNKYISNNHDVTSFIKFSVNGFDLDTRDIDSFKHYAVSMENTKTGVGQGNQFKIKIAYHKHFSNYSNINQLEIALGPLKQSSLFASSNGNVMQETKNNLIKNQCTLQYGYISNDQNLISPVYTGTLLKYSVNANKQIVEYTLEGFTGEQTTLNTVNWYPNVVGMTEVKTESGKRVALADIQNKSVDTDSEGLAEYIQILNNEYSGGISFQPYLALDCFLQDYNNSVSDTSIKYYLIDCTNNHKGKLSDPSTLKPVRMSVCRGQTVSQYIDYCISLFQYQKTDNYAIQYLKQKQQTTERFIYNFVKDPDDPYKILVCVDYLDSSEVEDSKIAYKFTGYASDNALLIDYSVNYDGTVALAISDYFSEDEDDTGVIYIRNDGSLRKTVSLTRDLFVAGEADNILIAKQNTWLDAVSVANNATLTTFGLPFEITVGTLFRCGIYITDTLHHTSGNCFVTNVTDKIEGVSFTTTFNMIRLPGKNPDLEV